MKQIFTLALTFLLIFSLVTVTAFATDAKIEAKGGTATSTAPPFAGWSIGKVCGMYGLRLYLVFLRMHDGQPLGKRNDKRNKDTDRAEHDAVDKFLTSCDVRLGMHNDILLINLSGFWFDTIIRLSNANFSEKNSPT